MFYLFTRFIHYVDHIHCLGLRFLTCFIWIVELGRFIALESKRLSFVCLNDELIHLIRDLFCWFQKISDLIMIFFVKCRFIWRNLLALVGNCIQLFENRGQSRIYISDKDRSWQTTGLWCDCGLRNVRNLLPLSKSWSQNSLRRSLFLVNLPL